MKEGKVKRVKLLEQCSRLTEGAIYDVVKEDSQHYFVNTVYSDEVKIYKHFFEIVEYDVGGSEITNIEGSSSSYYDLKIKRKDGSVVTCTAQDIISSILADNWHFGNIFKALCRIAGKRAGGGKAGTSEKYDANKIVWFGEDFKSRL